MVQNKFYLSKDYHLAPSEIDRMIYFEYEQLLDIVNDYAKKQAKQEEEQQQSYKVPKMGDINRQASSSIPKISIPKF